MTMNPKIVIAYEFRQYWHFIELKNLIFQLDFNLCTVLWFDFIYVILHRANHLTFTHFRLYFSFLPIFNNITYGLRIVYREEIFSMKDKRFEKLYEAIEKNATELAKV